MNNKILKLIILFVSLVLVSCTQTPTEEKSETKVVVAGKYLYLENLSYCMNFVGDSAFLQELRNDSVVRTVNKGVFALKTDTLTVKFPDELFTAKLKNDSIFFENFGGRPSTFVKKIIVM